MRQKHHKFCFAIDRFTRASVGSRHSIITPSDNSSVILPATVTIAANATDSDGTISKVDFYSNAILMTSVTAAPYSVTLAGFNLGSYTFTAVATDNSGASTTSAPVNISVTSGASQVYYIHTDQLNTPRLITDSNNAKVWEWNNDDPFGNNPPNDDPNATGKHFTFNQRFAGQYADKETGTNYNYYRDIYFTDQDRYGQFDPIGLAGGSMSPYVYVGGNPLSFTDEDGLLFGATLGGFQRGITLRQATQIGSMGNAALKAGGAPEAAAAACRSLPARWIQMLQRRRRRQST